MQAFFAEIGTFFIFFALFRIFVAICGFFRQFRHISRSLNYPRWDNRIKNTPVKYPASLDIENVRLFLRSLIVLAITSLINLRFLQFHEPFGILVVEWLYRFSSLITATREYYTE